MLIDSYTVDFSYSPYSGKFTIPLIADVELYNSEPYYIIRNVRTPIGTYNPVFSDIQLKKINGQWLHRDSFKETDLSVAVGKAIEDYEKSRQD